jgi:DNA-binding Lrp family transcriptional regulator
LGSDEETVLREIGELKRAGVIRRIGALINYQALGRKSTLVAAHVPGENLKAVAEAVNSLAGVSHNYQRSHDYNLWFTLQGESEEEIEQTLGELGGRFDIEFHSLPVKRYFKLDVRFDIEGEREETGVGGESVREVKTNEVEGKVELSDIEKRVLVRLQGELELRSKPYELLCEEGSGEEEVLEVIRGLVDKGVIRRIAAVLDYRKLGFTANVLFCSEVPEENVVGAGERLAQCGIVSHCYERATFEGWRYNLFAMMHGRSMGEIQHGVSRFVEAEGIDSYELLTTEAELKKKPVRYEL